jgi:type II secretory pathway pseudopilin PulG
MGGAMRRGAFALLEILAVLVIIMVLYYTVMKLNSFKNRTQLDRQTEQAVKDAGINTENYITIKNSMKDKIEQINQQHAKDLGDFGEKAGQ